MTNADEKTQQRFMVLMEQMRSQMQAIAEAHGILNHKMDRLGERLDAKVDGVATDLKAFARRVEEQFFVVNTKLAHVSEQVNQNTIQIQQAF